MRLSDSTTRADFFRYVRSKISNKQTSHKDYDGEQHECECNEQKIQPAKSCAHYAAPNSIW